MLAVQACSARAKLGMLYSAQASAKDSVIRPASSMLSNADVCTDKSLHATATLVALSGQHFVKLECTAFHDSLEGLTEETTPSAFLTAATQLRTTDWGVTSSHFCFLAAGRHGSASGRGGSVSGTGGFPSGWAGSSSDAVASASAMGQCNSWVCWKMMSN